MTAFVLDSSVALSWCFEDELTKASVDLLQILQSDSAAVPVLWHFEIANVLAISERRGRITQADAEEYLRLIEGLSIEADATAHSRAFRQTLALARAEALTAYDAAYLELAMRLGLPLASKDAALCDAAERVGAEVLRCL
jgi:predicted nucleic acid-binding protein